MTPSRGDVLAMAEFVKSLADMGHESNGPAGWVSPLAPGEPEKLIAADAMLRDYAALLDRRFPILGGGSVPWTMVAPFEAQALSNHCGQSLEKLASRGGLSAHELLWVLNGVRAIPRKDDKDYAESVRIQSLSNGEAQRELDALIRSRSEYTELTRLREELQKRSDVTTAQTIALTELGEEAASQFNRAESLQAALTAERRKVKDLRLWLSDPDNRSEYPEWADGVLDEMETLGLTGEAVAP